MPVEPFFSVVMPVYLGPYRTAAKDRPEKFVRAVESVWAQTFMDWELRIVHDGCEESFNLSQRWAGSERIHRHLIEKQAAWNGRARNAGIAHSTGKWVAYLDADDVMGIDHLRVIHDALRHTETPADWAWFNHFEQWRNRWRETQVRPEVKHRSSTFNFVHRRLPHIGWPDYGTPAYGHDDRAFAELLCALGPGPQLPTPEYRLCHKPNHYDV